MRRLSVLALVLGAASFVAVACGNQAEGQVCNRLNANDDCEVGFECRDPGLLSGVIQTDKNIGRCCPGDPNVPAKADVCKKPIGSNVDLGLADAGRD